MWLQNLLVLGTVVCSISAPTRPPSPATRPFQHVDAIKEALSLLNQNSEPAAVMVSEGGNVGRAWPTSLACTSFACQLDNTAFSFFYRMKQKLSLKCLIPR